MKEIIIQLLPQLIQGFESGREVPIPLSLFDHRLKTAFFISFKKPRTSVQQLCNHGGSSDIPQSISIEAMGTNGLYGIERPGSLFKNSINMIMKSESFTKGNAEYVQFADTFNARYSTGIRKLSFPSWVVNNDFLGFSTV